ncbi:MAG: type II secretion system protein GspE, partial [Zetaproteobacteria bacterium]
MSASAALSHPLPDQALARRFGRALLRAEGVVPLAADDALVVLIAEDARWPWGLLHDMRRLAKKPLRPVVAPRAEVEALLDRAFAPDEDSAAEAVEALAESAEAAIEELKDLLDVEEDAPAIRLVNTLLAQALRERASDIHIEPYAQHLDVRFRIDGVLHKIVEAPKSAHAAIASRIKVMAGLDIAEKRRPQDGRFRVRVAGRNVDVRVSVLPTAFGERIVLRLLDLSARMLTLEELGMAEDHLAMMRRVIASPHGIALVTGPTGSGKTTTLYAALLAVDRTNRNVMTIEDPIEYQIEDVAQMQVNPKTGLTFAAGLRSILRQDPDIVMVGEIRDLETAEIAVQASLTGHLVFATLHTNDALSSIVRLVDMGVEPYLIASSLILAEAQRLVRRLCPACRAPRAPTAEDWRRLE